MTHPRCLQGMHMPAHTTSMPCPTACLLLPVYLYHRRAGAVKHKTRGGCVPATLPGQYGSDILCFPVHIYGSWYAPLCTACILSMVALYKLSLRGEHLLELGDAHLS